MSRALRPFMPPLWLLAYAYFCWASREIDPMHEDVLKVQLRRRYYAGLLGIQDARAPSRPGDFTPQHWNCRCALPPRRQ